MKPSVILAVIVMLCGCAHEPATHLLHREMKPPSAIENDISIYFSPNGGAMAAILHEIGAAHRSVDVQAYLITASEIVDALKSAQERGVQVRIVLDKNNPGGVVSNALYLPKSILPVWRDGRHKDAHDKVMLIDGQTIITGSFNFTDQSEDTNAENLLIIRGKPKLFAAYAANFETHLRHSDPPQ